MALEAKLNATFANTVALLYAQEGDQVSTRNRWRGI